MGPKDIIPDEPDRGDVEWLDEILLGAYARIKNRRGARNLLEQSVDAHDYVLNDLEHLRLDLADFNRKKVG